MAEEQNILPPLPSGDELEARKREAQYDEVRRYLLDATKNYPEPYYMLEYKGVPFSTIGGIQALSGQKKNGKTFVLAQLMAVILAPDAKRVGKYLHGLTVPERTLRWMGHKPVVLYVDTEMEELNSAKVLRRVHWFCGWPMDVPNARFQVLRLRGITETKDLSGKVIEKAYAHRKRLILLAIEMIRPDAVFIDGIRDIIGDFNDNEESSQLVTELMALAEDRRMCIWNVLHMNPKPGNDDESKMRGHLGTELGNKITDTLVSIKTKSETGHVTFTVKQNDARGKDMENWKFEVTDAAGALGIPQILGDGNYDKDFALVTEADHYFKAYNWQQSGATYTDLERYLRTKGVTSNRKIKQLFDIALERGILFKNDRRRYHYHGLDHKPVNDSSENLPFSMSTDDDAPF